MVKKSVALLLMALVGSANVSLGMFPRLSFIEEKIFLREDSRIGRDAMIQKLALAGGTECFETGLGSVYVTHPCLVLTMEIRPTQDGGDQLSEQIYNMLMECEQSAFYVPEPLGKYTQYWRKNDEAGVYFMLRSTFDSKEALLAVLGNNK